MYCTVTLHDYMHIVVCCRLREHISIILKWQLGLASVNSTHHWLHWNLPKAYTMTDTHEHKHTRIYHTQTHIHKHTSEGDSVCVCGRERTCPCFFLTSVFYVTVITKSQRIRIHTPIPNLSSWLDLSHTHRHTLEVGPGM